MTDVGRNSPCPCGSGKKYKRCCLARGRLDHRRWEGLDVAMEWILRHHGEDASGELFENYWGPFGDALMARLDEPPAEVEASLRENSDEWLVAQGHIWTGERTRTAMIDVLLAPGGPKLDVVQQRWLRSFSENPLGIYEVREVTPAGMTVVDLADPDRPLLRVAGRAIPPEADEPSALVAMRLLPEDDHWIRTVAWYPFERSFLPKLEEAITQARAEWDGPEDRRWFLGSLVAELWWGVQARAHLSPEELETARKSELRDVTDSYRVVDGDRLNAALSTADRVEGNREIGWTHFERPADTDETYWIHALNPGADGRLVLFALSELRADEGREWLEGLVGDAVVSERREIRGAEEYEVPSVYFEGWEDASAAEKTARAQSPSMPTGPKLRSPFSTISRILPRCRSRDVLLYLGLRRRR